MSSVSSKHSYAFGYKSPDVNSFSNKKHVASKILGYVPVIGSFIGIGRIVIAAKEHDDDMRFTARQISRGLVETTSLGVVLLIADLAVTAFRALKGSNPPGQSQLNAELLKSYESSKQERLERTGKTIENLDNACRKLEQLNKKLYDEYKDFLQKLCNDLKQKQENIVNKRYFTEDLENNKNNTNAFEPLRIALNQQIFASVREKDTMNTYSEIMQAIIYGVASS